MAHIKRSIVKQRQRVLSFYEETANIKRSCKSAKVPRRTFYNWLKDEEFRKQFDESGAMALGVLEDEATRRAIEGTLKPVFQQGKKVGTIREYSDTLIIVLLKARAPHKYKERFASELTGKDGKELNPCPVVFLSADRLTDAQLDKYLNKDAGPNDEDI